MQSWLTLASELYTKHLSVLVLLQMNNGIKTLQQYNGEEGLRITAKIVTKATQGYSATALQAVLDNSPKNCDAPEPQIKLIKEDITFT